MSLYVALCRSMSLYVAPCQALKTMMEEDLAGERYAIKQYKSHMKLAAELEDPIIRRMLEDIIRDEEEHLKQPFLARVRRT
ncbi:MAG: ferritin-like domain-containing protein [Thermodesulfovibrionales bacterium]